MKNSPANKLLRLICAITFWGLTLGIINTVSGQSQNLGDFNVQLLPDWSYSNDKSSGDFFVFQNSPQKIEVAFKKEIVPCLNPMEITKVILPSFKTFKRNSGLLSNENRQCLIPSPDKRLVIS